MEINAVTVHNGTIPAELLVIMHQDFPMHGSLSGPATPHWTMRAYQAPQLAVSNLMDEWSEQELSLCPGAHSAKRPSFPPSSASRLQCSHVRL